MDTTDNVAGSIRLARAVDEREETERGPTDPTAGCNRVKRMTLHVCIILAVDMAPTQKTGLVAKKGHGQDNQTSGGGCTQEAQIKILEHRKHRKALVVIREAARPLVPSDEARNVVPGGRDARYSGRSERQAAGRSKTTVQ